MKSMLSHSFDSLVFSSSPLFYTVSQYTDLISLNLHPINHFLWECTLYSSIILPIKGTTWISVISYLKKIF